MAVPYVYSGNVYQPSVGATTFALTSTSGKQIKYLDKSDISVAKSIDSGATWTTLTRPAQWDFDTAGTNVVLVTATTAGDWVRVLRTTPFDDRYTTFAESALLTSDQLNDGEDFSLYVDQELYDKLEEIDGVVSGKAIKKITGVLPVEIDETDPQQPEISISLITKADAVKDPTSPSWDTDDKLATPAAIDRVYAQLIGDGSGFPGSGNAAKDGKLRIDDTGSVPEMFYWDSGTWIQIKTKGDKGDQGIQGIPGPPPGLQSPAASASNVALKPGNVLGDATAAVTADSGGDLKFDFGIPVGRTGATGPQGPPATPVVISQDTAPTFADDTLWFNTKDAKLYFGYTDPNGDEYWVSVSVPGPPGEAATVAVGSTTTGAPGSSANVTNSGTSLNAILDFVIPTGAQGPGGSDGADGAAATIAVGTTTTLAPGNDATVSNSGSSSAAVFDFGIPKGVTAVIQDAPPTTDLVDGQIWFDSVRGRSYMYWLSQTVWVQM